MNGNIGTRLHHPAVIAVLVLIWLLLTAWVRPLLAPDEGRYATVAWEMLRSGDWLTPTLNSLPFFHKPPLFYWITASALSVFGLHELPARAAPILGGWLLCMSCFLFIRRWVSAQAAVYSLIALAVHPLLYISAQYANLDMLVAGCMTVTICLLAHSALLMQLDQPDRRYLWAGYGFSALTVLAKGLIGVVLPGAVIVVWLLLLRQWRVLLRLISLPGLAIFLLIAAPWFVAMQNRFPDFLHYFFVVQHFQRFSQTGFNNAQPIWFYAALLLLTSLPWLLWLRPARLKNYFQDPQLQAVRWLAGAWLAVIVIFFSLPNSKLIGYILPVMLPIAFFAGAWMTHTDTKKQFWWLSACLSLIICWIFLGAIVLRGGNDTRLLASTLAAQRQADEPVMMVQEYFYDVPFYARLSAPVLIQNDWSLANVSKRDNWGKELYDAGVFDPQLASAVLINHLQAVEVLCSHANTWVFANIKAAGKVSFLQGVPLVAEQKGNGLWKLNRENALEKANLDCAKTPSAGSEHK